MSIKKFLTLIFYVLPVVKWREWTGKYKHFVFLLLFFVASPVFAEITYYNLDNYISFNYGSYPSWATNYSYIFEIDRSKFDDIKSVKLVSDISNNNVGAVSGGIRVIRLSDSTVLSDSTASFTSVGQYAHTIATSSNFRDQLLSGSDILVLQFQCTTSGGTCISNGLRVEIDVDHLSTTSSLTTSSTTAETIAYAQMGFYALILFFISFILSIWIWKQFMH